MQPLQNQKNNPEATGLTTIEYPHYQNFIDAIRADNPKLLACDITEGHLSSALPHLANISYRVGRALVEASPFWQLEEGPGDLAVLLPR